MQTAKLLRAFNPSKNKLEAVQIHSLPRDKFDFDIAKDAIEKVLAEKTKQKSDTKKGTLDVRLIRDGDEEEEEESDEADDDREDDEINLAKKVLCSALSFPLPTSLNYFRFY